MEITERQIELVETSAAALDPLLEGFAAAFYARLFSRHPGVRPMFVGDPDGQAKKLATELRRIVSALRDPERFSRQVRTLGDRHRRYGVVAGHYEVVGAVLIDTFTDVLGPQFTPELRDAWTAAYTHVAGQMLDAGRPAVPALR